MTPRPPGVGADPLPAAVLGLAGRGPDWSDWVHGLPALAEELLAQWQLVRARGSWAGTCSFVLGVLTDAGTPAVLKIGFVHEEAEHEHLALRSWGGAGAVRLLRADPSRGALLLERLRGVDLRSLDDVTACEVVAGLYPRLHVPAPPQLRPLAGYVERWGRDLAALPRSAPVPHRLVVQAVALSRELSASSGRALLHTDLHYENVLAADREPWLAIDPKPVAGDPHYELAPMLWNRWAEVAGDVRGGVRRRFHTLVEAAGLDEDRARDWVIVRMMHNAAWTLEEAAQSPEGLTAADRDWLTVCVSIAKAVQD